MPYTTGAVRLRCIRPDHAFDELISIARSSTAGVKRPVYAGGMVTRADAEVFASASP